MAEKTLTPAPAYKHMASIGTSGNYYGDIRNGLASLPPTNSSYAALGGSGQGTSYLNHVFARFSSLSSYTSVASATLTITVDLNNSDYKSGNVDLTIYGCSPISSSTTGTNMPTLYSGTATGTLLANSSTPVNINITAPLNAALANGSQCIYIKASSGNNRKAVGSMSLTYTSGNIVFNGTTISTLKFNGTTVDTVVFNGKTIF